MTSKNLVILSAVAVVLGGVAYWTTAGKKMKTPSVVGKKILPAFAVSDVARVEIGGAKEVYACASHGVHSGPANDRIEASPIKEMVFLNTIPEVANTPSHKIKFLDVDPVFARAIGHIHGATSIADLF